MIVELMFDGLVEEFDFVSLILLFIIIVISII